MFSNSGGFQIHGGHFYDVSGDTVNNNHRHGEPGINILHRAIALEALYDSADSFPQPRCHPETRTQMLEDLSGWAMNNDPNRSIRWLHGPAGAGKSAIMQTLSRRLHHGGYLGGSFFFKRGHTNRGNAKVLFATLAYQLALYNANLKRLISQAVEDDPSIVGRQMDVQLHKLIAEPCQLLTDAPVILLIDGLDECESEQVQQRVLLAIGNTVRQYPLAFRFLIASRPEAYLRETFNGQAFHGIHDSVNVEQSFEDVRQYFRDEFARIHREHRQTMRRIPTPWPSADVLAMLVEKSSGYFIYAATVIKFVDDKYFRPTERLQVIQNLTPNSSDSPFSALDQLYIQILTGVPARFHSGLREVLCVVANFNFVLSPEEIDVLLDLELGDVSLFLRGLHSVLRIPEEHEHEPRIHVHH
ncbi:hypothetical protein C8R44DRAFT_718215, partial [Mycena epipterygia]